MDTPGPHTKQGNLITRMHPLQRILISVVLSAIAFFLVPKGAFSHLLLAMLIWIVFSSSFIITSWIVMFRKPIEGIKKTARQDDGSKAFVFVMILGSSFASMLTVLLLMISKDADTAGNSLLLPAAISGMLLSWLMVHTMFTFHYAHMFYDDDDSGTGVEGGLDFPGNEEPDYIDFAYFSFVIGCTFQVSDVEVSSRKIRRMVLLHGLLAFVLNTFVVALTINFIAGLK